MENVKEIKNNLSFLQLDKQNRDDFAKLFGDRGACCGCWYMAWRLKSKEFETKKGASNKRSMKKIVSNNELPGINAYYKSEPIGWCAVAPRDVCPFNNSRVLAPVEDKPVRSISCFFIQKKIQENGAVS